jgi:hypothetical protein
MSVFTAPRPVRVPGPNGRYLKETDLPSPDTKRWVTHRKAEVVAAVRGGLLTLEDACARYKLSVDEFHCWQQAVEQHGIPGLRVTRIQLYRTPER